MSLLLLMYAHPLRSRSENSLGSSLPPALGGREEASPSVGVSVTKRRGERSWKPPVESQRRNEKIGWTSWETPRPEL